MAESETEEALHLYRVLARASESVFRRAREDLKRRGIHPTEFAILELLYHKGRQPLQRIGARILLASGGITYVVDKLERAGLLRREACTRDRRVTYAALTPEGRKLLDRIFPEHAEVIRRAMEGLDPVEKAELLRLLKKLGRGVESEPGD